MKSPILTVAGAVLVATAASACASTTTTPTAATASEGSVPQDTTAPSTTSASPVARTSSSPARSAAGSGAYANARAAWKQAGHAPLATMNSYIAKAAAALGRSGNPAYDDAVAELTELSNLPANGLTDSQMAVARKDMTDMDTFFGTPGLMYSPPSDDDGSGNQAAKACTSNDLRFTVTEESQKGGYYLLTASARPGVTCTLKGVTAAVMFGSASSSQAHPAEQAVGESIKLSGSKKAYAGVNPRTVDSNAEVDYPQIIVSASNDDPNPVSLHLDSPAPVNGPVATNWHTDPDEPVKYL